jgi:pyridoxal 5'-phosphate synthase pdxT subunit
MTKNTIGILALQGAFKKHGLAIKSLGHDVVYVRNPNDLERCDGLIIPGGESTTIAKLLSSQNFHGKLSSFAGKKPLFGTCAGLILMAKSIVESNPVPTLNILDVAVKRNGYGRQTDSFSTRVATTLGAECEAIFIRAPMIKEYGPGVKILARHEETPILVQEGHHLAASFHPELTEDLSIHKYFLSLCQ